ncbi:hypothetical protein JOF44_002550 [Brachybacterium fresconis]|uniref:Uncharacterized protein n=1 Tax=Brachybacterium fresconis TaxID=173363 RepID=A0ABS4YMM1_9MICO|nr:hypothetical protein [Brachybacterium fresconis]
MVNNQTGGATMTLCEGADGDELHRPALRPRHGVPGSDPVQLGEARGLTGRCSPGARHRRSADGAALTPPVRRR